MGFQTKGQFPFVDKMNLESKEKERLYQSTYTDKIEDLRDYDPEKNRLLVRIESQNEYPNYFFRDLNTKQIRSNHLRSKTHLKVFRMFTKK